MANQRGPVKPETAAITTRLMLADLQMARTAATLEGKTLCRFMREAVANAAREVVAARLASSLTSVEP